MAVTDAYAIATQYRNRLKKTDAADDSDILEDLKAVSRFIDFKCRRYFTKDDAVVARIYYPQGYFGGDPEAENPWLFTKGSRELRVDDIADRTGLVIKIDEDRDGSFADETALATTDYELWPLNADKGPEPKPWKRIALPAWSTRSGWPNSSPVEVTAKFGWPAIPNAIMNATIHLTGILRLESPRSTQRIPEGMDSAFAESSEAQDIIGELVKAYRRERLFA